MSERTMNPLVRFSLSAVAFLAAILLAASSLARSGGVVRLPNPGVKMKNGLHLEIDSRGAEATGYRPIRIKLSNSPPIAAKYDRQVRVTMQMIHGSGVYGRLAVSQVVEIPEGATSGEAVISVPRDNHGAYYMSLEVREGGQKLEDLSVPFLMLNTRGGGWGSGDESFPSLLFISSSVPLQAERDKLVSDAALQTTEKNPTYVLPDVRNAVSATHDGNTNLGLSSGQISDRSFLALLENSPSLDLLPPVELPERWIDLSTYSIIFIAREDLRTLATKFPSRKTALQEWLAAGAVLVVYDAGDDYQHLGEIEKLLELPPRPNASKKDVLYGDWMPARLADKNRRVKTYGSSSPYYGNIPQPAITTITPPEPSAPPNVQKTDASTPPFVSRPAHMGWLIAVPAKNPFPGSTADWEWLLASIPDQRESWSYRHGMSFVSHNDGFWNWHIAGVGAAPVFSFMLLASLFAVAIGPLNYLMLGRVQRLSMLLFTVPAGALIVTVALFLYALATDGLGVRTRVRSYTLLDQRSGQMVSWSRQTYFASIAPSRGLKFPADTLVFPVVLKPRDGMTGYKAIDWEKDGQRLKSGFIHSRSLAQFMVVRSAKSETRLEVSEQNLPLPLGEGRGEGKSAPHLQVRNTLGTNIQLLVLRDSRGSYFVAENLPRDATAEPAPAKAEGAQIALTRLIQLQDPKYPDGYDPTMSGNALTRMFRGAFPPGSSYSPVNTEVSLMEKSIDQITGANTEILEPGTYLAVVDITPDVPMGVTTSKQKESLHLIRGRW